MVARLRGTSRGEAHSPQTNLARNLKVEIIPLLAFLVSFFGALLTVGIVVYNAGRNRGFQESMEKSFADFKEETRRKLNGMPASIARLEQIAHDHGNRISKHKIEQEHDMERLEREIREIRDRGNRP